jgi:hypothetical protein
MDQLANLYAWQIKRGELTRTYAIMYIRNRHNLSMIDALEAIDFAIGEVNEFGSLTYDDPYATL